jgi:imidazole glycerol phosphate synthase glutamine amidotransferase subunit
MTRSKGLTVGIVDLGISNITSVSNAFKRIGYECLLLNEDSNEIKVDVLVLPGVGNFGYLAERLDSSSLRSRILEHHRARSPIIGICLGMQILFETSHESTSSRGLGLIPGEVKLLSSQASKECIRSVPNIGYNVVTALDGSSGCFKQELDALTGYYYFLHSYAVFDRQLDVDLEGVTKFAENEFSSFFLKENLCGIQFHPERSGEQGLYFLDQIMNHFDAFYKEKV